MDPPSPTGGSAPPPGPPADIATRWRIELRQLDTAAPWRWLRLGWGDFTRAPAIGVFYGACFVAMGWLLLALFRHAPAYTLALSAGFLLVGPFLCLGLYDVSRRLERREPVSFIASLTAWRTRTGTLALFGGLLLILEMLWGRAALVIFAVSFEGLPDFKGSVLALLDANNLGFVLVYLMVGSLFAGFIFAISVVAMPMILDRSTDAITAGLTSLRLCFDQPGVMLLWGTTLTLIVVTAMLPGFAGLAVAGPVLGHASWHAYREAVE